MSTASSDVGELERLRAVIAIQSEIASRALASDAVMQLVVDRARSLTTASGAVLELVDGDSMVYRAASGSLAPHVGLRLAARSSLSGLCVTTGALLSCVDTETDARVDREACRRVGARSLVVAPLRRGRETVGVLKVTSAQPSGFLHGDIALVELLANVVGSALERAAAEDQLRRAEETFRLTIDNAPIGMAIVGTDGRFLRVNAALCEIVGYTNDELLALTFHDVTHNDDLAADLALLDQLVRGEIPRYDLAKRYTRKDGTIAETTLYVSLVRDEAGQPRHFIAQIQDVTEKRRLQERVLLADRMASLGTLAAGVAHEMNNPLAAVSMNAEHLADQLRELAGGSPSGRVRELVEIVGDIRDGAERVRKIIRGLKSFARADEETRVPLDVRRVVDVAVGMSMNEIRHRARLRREQGHVPLVDADEGRLAQVFINLLVNAAQAIPEGKANENEITIRIDTDSEGWVVVEIRDTGEGIPAAIRGRVFDPFFTTKPIGVGSGLGLSISDGIVRSLGGEIGVESTPGQGTVFRVRLPASNASSTESLDGESGAKSSPAERRARILVVDDDVAVGRALRRTLGADHDIDVVDSGDAALGLLRAGAVTYDAIVSDLMMPNMTGMQLYDQLASESPDVAARMIFVTGGAFTAAAREFLDRVPNARLDKPIDVKALKQLVRSLGPAPTA